MPLTQKTLVILRPHHVGIPATSRVARAERATPRRNGDTRRRGPPGDAGGRPSRATARVHHRAANVNKANEIRWQLHSISSDSSGTCGRDAPRNPSPAPPWRPAPSRPMTPLLALPGRVEEREAGLPRHNWAQTGFNRWDAGQILRRLRRWLSSTATPPLSATRSGCPPTPFAGTVAKIVSLAIPAHGDRWLADGCTSMSRCRPRRCRRHGDATARRCRHGAVGGGSQQHGHRYLGHRDLRLERRSEDALAYPAHCAAPDRTTSRTGAPG